MSRMRKNTKNLSEFLKNYPIYKQQWPLHFLNGNKHALLKLEHVYYKIVANSENCK